MRRSWKLSHISWVVRRIFEFSGDGGGGLFSVISQCKLCSCSPPTSAHGQYMYCTCNCQKCALYPIYIVHSDDTCIYNWHLNYLASVMMTFQFSNNIFVMNIIYILTYIEFAFLNHQTVKRNLICLCIIDLLSRIN